MKQRSLARRTQEAANAITAGSTRVSSCTTISLIEEGVRGIKDHRLISVLTKQAKKMAMIQEGEEEREREIRRERGAI